MSGRWIAGLLLLMLAGCSTDEPAPGTDAPEGTTTPAAAGEKASDSGLATDQLDAMAVIGHSGATGISSDPAVPLESVAANSWATGDNPAVDSIYLRLLAEHPQMQGNAYNLAANGADIDQMLDQAAALSEVDGPLPDLVLVQGIDNDMRCDGTDPANARRFRDKFEQLVREVRRGNEGVAIVVVDQWGTPDAWARAVSDVEGQVLNNTGTGDCDLFDDEGRVRSAGVEGIRRISRLYYDAMASTCRRTPRCWTDGGAAGTVEVTPEMLGADYNHLSVEGHAALAEAVWQVLPDQVREAS